MERKVFLSIIGGLLMAFFANGQTPSSKLDFHGVEINGEFVKLAYELPFSGVVELRLMDDDGKLLFQSQYIDESGPNQIRLKAGAFEVGESYTLQLNYKEDIFRKEIQVGS